MIRVVIIDDEPMGVSALKAMIERLQMNVNIVATACDPEKGIKLIESYHPDVVFLDINMPKLNGFELLDKLEYNDFKLVFTTAHKEYAIKAIRNDACDYLLKPIDAVDLNMCMNKIIMQRTSVSLQAKSNSVIELPVRDGIILIKQSNIIRLEASGSYTHLFLGGGVKHTASKNLKYFEALLNSYYFFRCHQSHIVNLNEVTKILSSDGYYVQMSDQSKANLGKKYKNLFMQKLKSI